MSTETYTDQEIDAMIDNANKVSIILWNDDINTFDHVMHCLITVCKHNKEQAEQCAMIIHNNGKCDVKSGSMEDMKPMKDLLIDGGLSATIE